MKELHKENMIFKIINLIIKYNKFINKLETTTIKSNIN